MGVVRGTVDAWAKHRHAKSSEFYKIMVCSPFLLLVCMRYSSLLMSILTLTKVIMSP